MLPNSEKERIAQLALTFMPGIGPKMARQLLTHFGSAEAVIAASARELKKVCGMGETRASAAKASNILQRAEQEYSFITKHSIQAYFLTDAAYPARLKNCEDAPVLLYYKGDASMDAAKMVAVIGTRKHTEYGQQATEDLIAGLAGQPGLVVVSGLAYGIDAIAHRSCIASAIPTVGVVGHGLDRIYPSAHRGLAREMLAAGGGILAEFPSGTLPDRSNFPVRNRVVAGLSDVTVVVESDEKGGAMITAYMAASYNREVAAFPGRASDAKSAGPNKLIRMNIAHLIRNTQDLLDVMNWTATNRTTTPALFTALSDEEQQLVALLQEKGSMHADELQLRAGMSSTLLAATLLQLEMLGHVKTMPGKRYRLR